MSDTEAPRCIAYLPDGRVCGEPAYAFDHRRGGPVCPSHRGYTEEVESVVAFLTTIFRQRGADEMIQHAADDIVRLRRLLRRERGIEEEGESCASR